MFRILTFALVLLIAGAAHSQEFKVRSFVFNEEMEPKQYGDTANECLQFSRCANALKGLAAYAGIPPEAIDMATVISQLTYSRTGEETRYDLNTSPGYQTCRISVDVHSTVPLTGPRASTLDIAVHPNRIHMVSWTPVRNQTEGRSWVDATIELLEVRDDRASAYRASGKCHPTADRVWVYRCRGNGGDNEGRQACGTFRE